ncbi:MAG: RNA-binding protein [Firmicutes bacterium HGW-Firmicutes-1]|nr:MAG: RNA-binding protein [Firmicutes bacterium HGW-Firmicutes-1]
MILAKELLLVDGYNIIHAWDSLRVIVETDCLENARTKLIEEMSNLQGYYHNEVIIVFDAHKVKRGQRKNQKHHNVEVVYTKDAETADHYIERIASLRSKATKVRVATSDGLEQIIILAQGATRVSARELQEEVRSIKENIRKKYIENIRLNNNRLEGHLDVAVLEWMEKKRRE